MSEHIAHKCKTLIEIVHQRAAIDGDRIAYTFLADGAADARSISWSQLDQRASALGASLLNRGAGEQPVLLALSSGLAFVESLFACWYAGAIAIPVSLPRHQRVKHRLDRIVADAGARFAIGTTDSRQRLESDGAPFTSLTWLDAADAASATTITLPKNASENVAVLQYTSGSTGDPRGVIITHANIMRNSELIAEACGHQSSDTIAGWLPLFHDMGLIGLVLQAAFSGARCVFMPPERFLMRPRLWLQMISDYSVCSSPAPNFGYELCVDKITGEQKAGLDLSHWRNALNGSEPVRATTLDRFATAFSSCGFQRKALFPCYGLAEATLFVTGPGNERSLTRRAADGTKLPDDDPAGHVGCGKAFGDTQLAIVDPKTSQLAAGGSVGEIWIASESCAQGYWKNPITTAATFNGQLGNSTLAWLKTGDLGFISNGELFITGRLRELIIIAGRNHFPVDLERTAESADAAISTSGAVAFSIDVDGTERLIVVAEVRREFARNDRNDAVSGFDAAAIRRRLRAAIASEHEVTPHDVLLLRPGAVLRTTSGKISRLNTREAYLSQTLERLEDSSHVQLVS